MVAPSFRFTLILFLTGAAAVILAAILVFGGIFPPFFKRQADQSAFGSPQFEYRIVRFADLEGWRRDDLGVSFDAFLASCEKLSRLTDVASANPSENLGKEFADISMAGNGLQWHQVCDVAAQVQANKYGSPSLQQSAWRQFFEMEFTPIQILNRREPLPDGPAKNSSPRIEEHGTFTGYFEPAYAASHTQSTVYSVPVYPRPEDLIDVDLGAFREDLAGERVAGKLSGNRLVPYPDHQEINEGALAGKVDAIAWMEPNDLFFLQIQGSGQLVFDDGSQLHIGYAGQNGHPYTAIGRILVERELMPLSEVSMQTIREWLDTVVADDAQEMRESNASYVFFHELDQRGAGLGPLGAQGVSLRPERSLAVDRRYHALGMPVWVDIDPVAGNGRKRIQQLMIAQDTGGAIRGPVRGDVFWGAGEKAEEVAGKMNARGRMFVLIPKSVASKLEEYQRR